MWVCACALTLELLKYFSSVLKLVKNNTLCKFCWNPPFLQTRSLFAGKGGLLHSLRWRLWTLSPGTAAVICRFIMSVKLYAGISAVQGVWHLASCGTDRFLLTSETRKMSTTGVYYLSREQGRLTCVPATFVCDLDLLPSVVPLLMPIDYHEFFGSNVFQVLYQNWVDFWMALCYC